MQAQSEAGLGHDLLLPRKSNTRLEHQSTGSSQFSKCTDLLASAGLILFISATEREREEEEKKKNQTLSGCVNGIFH